MNLKTYIYDFIIIASGSLLFVSGQKVNLTVSKSITNDIDIYYFMGPTINDSIKLKLEDGLSLVKQPKFKPDKVTHFFFHGWGAKATNGASKAVSQALLDAGFCNVVSFDYSRLIKSSLGPVDYLIAIPHAKDIGQAIGEFFKQYIGNSQPLELIKMASHSLGAQIMAKVARTYGVGKLPRLTGLDPAGPAFTIPGVEHLEAADGEFVDIIHTDGGLNGDPRTLGHVDFFPNNGKRSQPGCHDLIPNPFSSCSHKRAYEYYAESILHSKNFIGKRCRRELLTSHCCCNDSMIATMGYYTNTTTRGTYFLKTGSTSPYGLGVAGLDFK